MYKNNRNNVTTFFAMSKLSNTVPNQISNTVFRNRRHVVNPRHQLSQGQSVVKPGTLLLRIKIDTKDSNGDMLIQYHKIRFKGTNILGGSK